jgi:23S rRNA pseudouridine2605 synthase
LSNVKEERLQKVLASAGIGSRRSAEELIEAGRVRVNGRVVTELGTKVDPGNARIEVDGRRVVRQPYVYLVLHKPRGCVSTLSDPEGRETVAGLVTDVAARVVPVGRLDYASSGVLLMTNDGDFMAKLLHPGGGTTKLYHAKVRGAVDERGLERWQRSIEIDGRQTRPAQVRVLEIVEDKTWLEIVLHEGRNRQIRRLGDEAGYPVLRLMRIEYAGVTVDDVAPGRWRYLTRDELLDLKRRFGVPKHMPASMPVKVPAARSHRTRAVKPVQAQRVGAGLTRPDSNARGKKARMRPGRFAKR